MAWLPPELELGEEPELKPPELELELPEPEFAELEPEPVELEPEPVELEPEPEFAELEPEPEFAELEPKPATVNGCGLSPSGPGRSPSHWTCWSRGWTRAGPGSARRP